MGYSRGNRLQTFNAMLSAQEGKRRKLEEEELEKTKRNQKIQNIGVQGAGYVKKATSFNRVADIKKAGKIGDTDLLVPGEKTKLMDYIVAPKNQLNPNLLDESGKLLDPTQATKYQQSLVDSSFTSGAQTGGSIVSKGGSVTGTGANVAKTGTEEVAKGGLKTTVGKTVQGVGGMYNIYSGAKGISDWNKDTHAGSKISDVGDIASGVGNMMMATGIGAPIGGVVAGLGTVASIGGDLWAGTDQSAGDYLRRGAMMYDIGNTTWGNAVDKSRYVS
tara:strand:+ start:315 stop:1139 length:825 start_codon:yes stop_codon:yes gene_type:complete